MSNSVQIVVPGVPRPLAELIEKEAKTNNRSRAGECRVLLREGMELRRRRQKTAIAA